MTVGREECTLPSQLKSQSYIDTHSVTLMDTHMRHFYSFLHKGFTVIALIAVYFICPSSFTARARASSLSLSFFPSFFLLTHSLTHTYIHWPQAQNKTHLARERHKHAVKKREKGERKEKKEKELRDAWELRTKRGEKKQEDSASYTYNKHAS